MSTLVSIIIPTYNRANLIAETLESVLAQTYENWECLVVDDGSTDDTKNIIKKYCGDDNRFTYKLRSQNHLKGANSCRNIGIKMAKGEFLLFLDSDDLLAPNCLESRICKVEKNPDFSIHIFKTKYFKESRDDAIKVFNKYPDSESDSYLKMFLRYDIPWQTTSMFIKRSDFNVFFNEKLMRFQDVEFSISLLLDDSLKIKSHVNSEADSFYRIASLLEARHLDFKFLNAINKSQLELMNSVVSKLKKRFNNKTERREHLKLLELFYLRNFRIYILPYITHLDLSFRKLRWYLWKEGVLSTSIFFKYGIIEQMYMWEWQNIKGLGAYRLKKKWVERI